jgi:hypothetical protein
MGLITEWLYNYGEESVNGKFRALGFVLCALDSYSLECDGLPSLCYNVTESRGPAVTKRRQAVAL